jgi:predicted GNAT family N-acyltransferase
MEIFYCDNADIPQIISLYDHARQYQQQKQMVVWPAFAETTIQNEIEEQRQFKIVINDEIACNWCITLEDPFIWEEKDNHDAIYIHRLCTNSKYRGLNLSHHMVTWAISFAKSIRRKYLRLDSVGQNDGLIKHYTSIGFDFLGPVTLSNTSNLPQHYQQDSKCLLFEIDISK